MTPYHAKLFAFLLTRRCPPDSPDNLAGAVAGARVDLNPHQVEAALFAFRSPLSHGALLADEVGLGKTIEAGIVLAQYWAEKHRRLLVIVPSNLRKQWHQELTEKFFLPCEILEAKSYNRQVREGNFDPFGTAPGLVICSYQFARSKAVDLNRVNWDLVVMDEAHRLRNVYKSGNVIANTLKKALAQPRKLLLTATPLQNSLLELYGLVSLIDDYVFGDLSSFKTLFAHPKQENFEELRKRLLPVCHRTLRRQVHQYVSFTRRIPILQEFTPAQAEDELYNRVSDYLRRPELMALPKGQRALIILVMRKLLASSSFAIAGALQTMANRMRAKIQRQEGSWQEDLGTDYESLEATAEELNEEEAEAPLTPEQIQAMETEIAELEDFAQLATSIQVNAKGQALVQALEIAFHRAQELGGSEKAVIFTESRKTQSYLQRILAETRWKDKVVLFNGTNTDPASAESYRKWLATHKGTDRVTGSKSADMRAALVEEFRERGQILIATEAGAEGINLQFCSLVVNYDLPWNPQRIEQRIGRCHRYGQKHDVVVVNFLNRNNEADQRVFQLLSEKFQLFEGVFGASDEILGAIDSGVDFEHRIAAIYQECRKPQEIQAAFDQLQQELGSEIATGMRKARLTLLENFDEEVCERLRLRDHNAREQLGRHEQMLMALTAFELADNIQSLDECGFELASQPSGLDIPLGRYELPRRNQEAYTYRLGHPLADAVIQSAKGRVLTNGEICFQLSQHSGKISLLDKWKGQTGILTTKTLSLEASALSEDHLLWSAVSDAGELMPVEAVERLWTVPSNFVPLEGTCEEPLSLNTELEHQKQDLLAQVQGRNGKYLDEESAKLDAWADDAKTALEVDLKNIDREIRETKKQMRAAKSLDAKVELQRRVRSLEGARTQKRKALFDAQDEVDRKREELVDVVEARLAQNAKVQELFTVRWRVE
ncbi:MAG TPA: SNF2-related protein [Fibrobacteraceae bacterium]|nr:SNF2-related protein [Fibrobacteraceae bacterium]